MCMCGWGQRMIPGVLYHSPQDSLKPGSLTQSRPRLASISFQRVSSPLPLPRSWQGATPNFVYGCRGFEPRSSSLHNNDLSHGTKSPIKGNNREDLTFWSCRLIETGKTKAAFKKLQN